MNLIRSAAVLLVLAPASAVFAQGMLNYVDPSDNSTRRSRRVTESSTGNANASTAAGSSGRIAPTPKGSPTPASGKGSMTSTKPTSSKSGGTTSTLAKSGTSTKPGGNKSATASGGFEQKGQLKEVTKQMVESIRTRKVDFDEEEAAADPAIILLNPRKLTPQEHLHVKTDDLARPL
ncbi:MAG: hypothetical protein ACR2IE_11155 [Candidatus Sumerlaeaceae bacterium]